MDGDVYTGLRLISWTVGRGTFSFSDGGRGRNTCLVLIPISRADLLGIPQVERDKGDIHNESLSTSPEFLRRGDFWKVPRLSKDGGRWPATGTDLLMRGRELPVPPTPIFREGEGLEVELIASGQ